LNNGFVIFEIETSGLNPTHDEIIRINAIRIVNKKITDRFSSLVRSEKPLSEKNEKLTGIKAHELEDQEDISIVLRRFVEWYSDDHWVTNNSKFTTSFIINAANKHSIFIDRPVIDIANLVKLLSPNIIESTSYGIYESMFINKKLPDFLDRCYEIFIHEIKTLESRSISIY